MHRPALVALALFAAAAHAAPTRLAVQKGTFGTVRDCYIWKEALTYNGNGATLYVGQVGATDKRSFLQFDLSALPAGATVVDARLVLEATGASGVEVRVHEISADWTETSPTWGTFGDSFLPEVAGRFKPVAGRNHVEVTQLVQAWADGRPNRGVALVQDTLTSASTFHSSDQSIVSLRPLLEVLYAPGPLVADPALPPLEVACGVDFSYPLRAHAPDATGWSIDAAPEGLDLDAVTGELTWTPARAATGDHAVTVTATDGRRTESLEVSLRVECGTPLQVGCSAAPAGAWAALAGLLALRRRRPGQPRG